MDNLQAKELIESLMPLQEEGCSFPCPRCGGPMNQERLQLNALSRYAKVWICSKCGTDEALRDMRHDPLPLNEWSMAISFAEPSDEEDFDEEDEEDW